MSDRTPGTTLGRTARALGALALVGAAALGGGARAGASTTDPETRSRPAPVVATIGQGQETREWWCMPGWDLTDPSCLQWVAKCWNAGGVPLITPVWISIVCWSFDTGHQIDPDKPDGIPDFPGD